MFASFFKPTKEQKEGDLNNLSISNIKHQDQSTNRSFNLTLMGSPEKAKKQADAKKTDKQIIEELKAKLKAAEYQIKSQQKEIALLKKQKDSLNEEFKKRGSIVAPYPEKTKPQSQLPGGIERAKMMFPISTAARRTIAQLPVIIWAGKSLEAPCTFQYLPFLFGPYTKTRKGTWIGQHSNGQRNGVSIFVWQDGGFYEGCFYDRKRHGWGRWVSSNGNVYEGEWRASKMHGKGKQLWYYGPLKGCSYEGQFKDDKRSGKGVFTWANGDVYRGDFLDGRWHGYGVMKFKDGKEEYRRWKDDLPTSDQDYRLMARCGCGA